MGTRPSLKESCSCMVNPFYFITLSNLVLTLSGELSHLGSLVLHNQKQWLMPYGLWSHFQ